jgi:hypothetical protein
MKKSFIILAFPLVIVLQALGDEHKRHEHHEHHNYIIERQEAYQVEGVPTDRLIIGKREIDIYRNGQMFEGDHMVGVRK